MKRFLPSRTTLTSCLEVLGLGLVVAGAGVLAIWLGLVLAGLVLIVLGYALDGPRDPGDGA